MRILLGDNFLKKGVSNVGKCRSGMAFHMALKRTLAVNKVVKNRFLKNRLDESPVACYSVSSPEGASTAVKNHNVQKTINMVAPNRKVVNSGGPICSGQLQVPDKFFCLPFFDTQDFSGLTLSPQRIEDIAEFQFVDAVCRGLLTIL